MVKIMNDFTKEELEILLEYLDYPVLEITETKGKRLQLAAKIVAMIEHYCEHRVYEREIKINGL